jgi:DNA-binding NtrC family response regulator
MNGGTIIFVGQISREAELLLARLKHEEFEVVTVPHAAGLSKAIKLGGIQAILVSNRLNKRQVRGVIQTKRANNRTRFIPVIIIAEYDEPTELQKVLGVGEIFRLHIIPLRDAVERLKLAIKLCQLSAG